MIPLYPIYYDAELYRCRLKGCGKIVDMSQIGRLLDDENVKKDEKGLYHYESNTQKHYLDYIGSEERVINVVFEEDESYYFRNPDLPDDYYDRETLMLDSYRDFPFCNFCGQIIWDANDRQGYYIFLKNGNLSYEYACRCETIGLTNQNDPDDDECFGLGEIKDKKIQL